MDLRTRDYVLINGRSYRRTPLSPSGCWSTSPPSSRPGHQAVGLALLVAGAVGALHDREAVAPRRTRSRSCCAGRPTSRARSARLGRRATARCRVPAGSGPGARRGGRRASPPSARNAATAPPASATVTPPPATRRAKNAWSSSLVWSTGRYGNDVRRAAWKIVVTAGASPGRAGLSGMAVGCQTVRILTLSWEYPPIVEGGLARHVRKLSEQLVRDGHEVHVVTRGGGRLEADEDRHGVIVHRVREPEFPKDDLDAFIAWVDHMNEDMLAAGAELGGGFDLVHSHDWLVAAAARALARRRRRAVARDRPRDRVRAPPGLGRQAPAVAHPRRRAADGPRRRPRDHVLALHARAGRRRLRRAARARSPRSRTASTRPTCSPSPTCRGCARSSPRRTRSSSCSSAGSSTRRASTSRWTRCRG